MRACGWLMGRVHKEDFMSPAPTLSMRFLMVCGSSRDRADAPRHTYCSCTASESGRTLLPTRTLSVRACARCCLPAIPHTRLRDPGIRQPAQPRGTDPPTDRHLITLVSRARRTSRLWRRGRNARSAKARSACLRCSLLRASHNARTYRAEDAHAHYRRRL